MTDLDDTLRAEVYSTIQTLGKELVFYSNAGAPGTYNPATGASGSIPSPLTYSYKTSPPAAYTRRWGATDLVEQGDLSATLPAKGLDSTFESSHLKPAAKVTFDSNTYIIVDVEKVYSGDQICAYNLLLRQRHGS